MADDSTRAKTRCRAASWTADKGRASAAVTHAYLKERPPEFREFYGEKIQFADDGHILGLQAADLWAWWIREWDENGQIESQLDFPDFGAFSAARRKHPKIDISISQDQMVKNLIEIARGYIEPGRTIYDVQFNPPSP